MSSSLEIEILNTQELSKILGVTDRTIYRKVENKEIPFFRVGDKGSVRFLKSKILSWIEAQHKKQMA